MLTVEEELKVHALHQRRVRDGRYLCDVEIKNLRIEEVMDLVTSALYANERAEYMPYERNLLRNEHRQLVIDVLNQHRRNIRKYETLSM